MKAQTSLFIKLSINMLLFWFTLPIVVIAQEPTENKKPLDVQLQTRLMLAIRHNNLADVKAAVNEGADVKESGYRIEGEIAEGWKPMQEAARQDNVDIARYLTSKGAPLDGDDVYGNTPLMVACSGGKLKIAKWLLQHKVKVDTESAFGTALFGACSQGHIELVRLLIRYKAKVNYRDSARQRTPLFYAASQGHTEVVKLLLKNKADVNARDSDGDTALKWAKKKHQDAVIAILLAAGAKES